MLDERQLIDVLEAHLWSMWGPLGSCPGGRTIARVDVATFEVWALPGSVQL